MTSQTHQPPGSSRATPLNNYNSRSSGFAPHSSSSQTGMPMPYPNPGFTVTGSGMKSAAP